ncbi:hypothetical protein PL373_08065 [Tenacibaculum maritimum]|nr:hypothetical protein [Tenacibaculum maritimum]MDB0601101.1 hypothetical protein [Tenacibaculum maritimum]MDB0612183.1 hypothetical protein [Tenacibaculum maritimum]
MTTYYTYAFFDKNNEQHKYILSLCQQLGWTKDHPKWGKVSDLERLGRFIALDCKHKIALTKQTKIQLQTTIYQLEQVLVK